MTPASPRAATPEKAETRCTLLEVSVAPHLCSTMTWSSQLTRARRPDAPQKPEAVAGFPPQESPT